MNLNKSKVLLDCINEWRSLEAKIQNEKPFKDLESEKRLSKIRNDCTHSVYVHLSTDYKDDGLGDPDFYSSYRCLVCGSTSYDVPAYRTVSNSFQINMQRYESEKYYSDEEKFAIAETYLRQLIKKNPNCSVKEIICLLNEKIAKKK